MTSATSGGSSPSHPVEVAVAILEGPDGRVLLAQRPMGKVYAGYWEFPGGKVEPGEAVEQALAREIDEELGIQIQTHQTFPWITQVFTYPHATVRLHFYRIYGWQGEPRAVEHAGLSWQHPDAISVAPLLPANGPVLKGLMLPAQYAISAAQALGTERFLARLESRLAAGLRLIQLREKDLAADVREKLAAEVVRLAHRHAAKVLINGDVELARRTGADGVHLTSAQLSAATQAGTRPDITWVAASCHAADELRMAEKLGADFAVLGPVLATASHPGAPFLGWDDFHRLVQGATIPVYALGGLQPAMLDMARSHGAHGLAMLSASWHERALSA